MFILVKPPLHEGPTGPLRFECWISLWVWIAPVCLFQKLAWPGLGWKEKLVICWVFQISSWWLPIRTSKGNLGRIINGQVYYNTDSHKNKKQALCYWIFWSGRTYTQTHTAQINSHYNYKIEMIIISFLSISEDAGRYSSPELGHELELSFHGLLDIFERGNEPRKLYKEKKNAAASTKLRHY